jgi:hypothetical protein
MPDADPMFVGVSVETQHPPLPSAGAAQPFDLTAQASIYTQVRQ